MEFCEKYNILQIVNSVLENNTLPNL